MQERLLAPRVLHFCEGQIAWECRELDACENDPAGSESLELRSGIIRDRVRFKSLIALDGKADVAYESHENWKRIIERYFLTNLTKPIDKLLALAGIAEQMSTQICAPYVAGIWKNAYFASQLLWRVETRYKNGKFLYPSQRPQRYRAPSFSWAAIDAPQGIRCGETQHEEKLLIKVIEVDVPPLQPDRTFGLVKEGGFIKVRCQKLPIAIEKKSRITADGDQHDIYNWTLRGESEGEDGKMHPSVYLDSPKDDFSDSRGSYSSMWLVPAYKNSSGDLIGLLLEQKDNRGHFRRVGLSVIPHYLSSGKAFMDHASADENGQLGKVKEEVIQIV